MTTFKELIEGIRNRRIDNPAAALSVLLNTGGALDHGSLTGLADDDHPQYPQAAATETISGAWTFSTNPSITNTAPLINFYDTDDSANTGKWLLIASSQLFRVFAVNDAESAFSNALAITRSGSTALGVQLPLDNLELQIGAGQDLRLYHDGVNSFIDNDTGLLRILGATSGEIVLNTTGALYGTALHNNSGAVTGATNQYVVSGTYTPTLTNVTNVAASTPRQSQWMRVGNVVTVSGQFDVDPTGTGATELGVSLPIASALTTAFQLGGGANSNVAAGEEAMIDADATNDRARVRWVAVDITNHTYAFTFTYEVL